MQSIPENKDMLRAIFSSTLETVNCESESRLVLLVCRRIANSSVVWTHLGGFSFVNVFYENWAIGKILPPLSSSGEEGMLFASNVTAMVTQIIFSSKAISFQSSLSMRSDGSWSPHQFCPENGRTLVFLWRLYLVLHNCFMWIHKHIFLCGSWQFKPYLRCFLGLCLAFATSFDLHCLFIRPGGLTSCLGRFFFFFCSYL